MTDEILIRPATAADSEAISRTILSALHHSNAQDYAPEIIASVAASFTPERILGLISQRDVLVAAVDGEVVGTASLQGSTVRTVFVAPRCQGRGIGAALMTRVERRANAREIVKLVVPSSVTAEGFYRRIGYTKVSDRYSGAERTIIMEKDLGCSIRSDAATLGEL